MSKVASGGEKRDIKVKAVYDIERPNHLSLKTEVDGDPAKGPDIIADGKNLTIFGKSRKQYTQETAPEKLEDMVSPCSRSDPRSPRTSPTSSPKTRATCS